MTWYDVTITFRVEADDDEQAIEKAEALVMPEADTVTDDVNEAPDV